MHPLRQVGEQCPSAGVKPCTTTARGARAFVAVQLDAADRLPFTSGAQVAAYWKRGASSHHENLED